MLPIVSSYDGNFHFKRSAIALNTTLEFAACASCKF
jgi:hypothetical protein